MKDFTRDKKEGSQGPSSRAPQSAGGPSKQNRPPIPQAGAPQSSRRNLTPKLPPTPSSHVSTKTPVTPQVAASSHPHPSNQPHHPLQPNQSQGFSQTVSQNSVTPRRTPILSEHPTSRPPEASSPASAPATDAPKKASPAGPRKGQGGLQQGPPTSQQPGRPQPSGRPQGPPREKRSHVTERDLDVRESPQLNPFLEDDQYNQHYKSSQADYGLGSSDLHALLDSPYESTNNDFEAEKTEIQEFPFAGLKRTLERGNENVKVVLEGLSSICMGERYYLGSEGYMIGRSPKNHIVLSDRSLSRSHAELIVNTDGRAIVQDLGSSNGTFLNGHRISKADLRDGDQLKFGEAIFRFTQVTPVLQASERRVINEQQQPIVIDDLKPAKQKTKVDPLKLVVIAAIVASLLVAVMLTVFVIKLNNDNEIKRAKSEARFLYLEGVSAMRNRDWDRAEAQFKHVQALDPSMVGLTEQFNRIESERAFGEALEAAIAKANAGKPKEARREAEKIPRDSIYYNQAHKLLLSLE